MSQDKRWDGTTQKLYVDVHFSKSKKRWVYECQRILADGKSRGKTDRRVLKDGLSRVPYSLYMFMLPGVDKIRANREDKSFTELKDKVMHWLCGVPKVFGGSGKESNGYVTWFDGNKKRIATIAVLNLYEHPISKDDKALAGELREHNNHFRRMEEKSRAPLRFAYVFLKDGAFIRFVPARVKDDE